MTEFYHERRLARLQLIWGAGYLSPGGPEDVRAIVGDAPLNGRRVLDLGCGVGGPALLLAKERGATVVGADVSALVLAHAERLAQAEGLSHAIRFDLIAPGKLPYRDGSFDVVFSKDAMVHVPDKPALFQEILRILRPGGAFLASDWLCGENAREDAALSAWLQGDDSFEFTTLAKMAEALRAAGFGAVALEDRNAWFVEQCRSEYARLDGPLRAEAVELMGAEAFEAWLSSRKLLVEAASSGALRPAHIRAARPER